MQWYSVPPLLKLWMDKVLSHGWAYGHNGIALRGKSLMWAVTTGGGESHFDIGSFPGFRCWRSRCRRPRSTAG
jgi:glutathione-regulated potassium-efflux system ancillary protein KefF